MRDKWKISVLLLTLLTGTWNFPIKSRPPPISSHYNGMAVPWTNRMSNKRQEIIYALDEGWTKRDQRTERMSKIETHGQSLNADGDRNDNSPGHAPVDPERIHSHGFHEILVNKVEGPPGASENTMEEKRKQDDLKLYGSIGSAGGTSRAQKPSGTTAVVNNNPDAITITSAHPNASINTNKDSSTKNDVNAKIKTNSNENSKPQTVMNSKPNEKTDSQAGVRHFSSDGGHASLDPNDYIQPSVFSFSQDDINKGLLSQTVHSSDAAAAEHGPDSSVKARERAESRSTPTVLLSQPSVQLMPVMAAQALGQNMPQAAQSFAGVIPVIPPQSNLVVPMMQQPADNADKRGMFLQPMQQVPSQLVYNPVIMPPQSRYFASMPQYFFPTPQQFEPPEQSTLFISPQQQAQPDLTVLGQQPVQPGATETEPVDSQASQVYVPASEQADKSRDRWTTEQGHSRSEVMDEPESRDFEERKELEREESEEQDNLYGRDGSDDYEGEQDDDDEDRRYREPDEDREPYDPETDEENPSAHNRETEMPEDEDEERDGGIKSNAGLNQARDYQEKDTARQRFLQSHYPAEVEGSRKLLQSQYARAYPADDVTDSPSPTLDSETNRPLQMNFAPHVPADDVRKDSSEAFQFPLSPPSAHPMMYNSFEPEKSKQPFVPIFNSPPPRMTAETFSRYQVSNPESEIKPEVIPMLPLQTDANSAHKNMISLPQHMEMTQMSADKARFMEGHMSLLRTPYSPLESKDKIPRGGTSDKSGFGNTLILLNGKPLEDASQLRSRIVNGKIVEGRGKLIKSKGPVKVRMSHTKDARHMKIINIIAPQQYRVIDTKNIIGRPSVPSRPQFRIHDKNRGPILRTKNTLPKKIMLKS